MLTRFREDGLLKGIMAVVVVLIIAAFAFTGGGGGGQPEPALCVVEVEGECVEVGDYNALMRLVAPPGASNKQLRKMGFTDQALEGLIERELLLKEARRLGVAVSEEELDDELASGRVHFSWPVAAPYPQAMAAGRSFPTIGANETVTYLNVKDAKTGAFDFKKYQRQVQRIMRMSNKDFKRSQRSELIAARVRRMIATPVTVSEEEVFSQFERQKSSATTRTVAADAAWFARFAPRLADEAVATYAAEHKEELDKAWEAKKANWEAGCPLVSEIFIKFPAGADDAEKAAAEERLQAARSALLGGMAFGAAARLHSDAATAEVDGFVGCVTNTATPTYYESAQTALAAVAPGNWSPTTITAADGLRLLKLEGTLGADAVETRGRQEIARALAAADQGRARAKAFAEAVIAAGKAGQPLKDATEAIRVKSVSLGSDAAPSASAVEAAVGHKLAPTMEISRTFTRASSPIFNVKGDVNAAALVFALEKDDDYVATPIETHSGFAVLQLKEKSLATREQFEEKKHELVESVREYKRAEALASYVERLRKGAQQIKISPEFGAAPAEEETPADESASTSG